MSELRRIHPKHLLLGAAFLSVTVCAFTVYAALGSVPWLGLHLGTNEQGSVHIVQAQGPAEALSPDTVVVALVDGSGTAVSIEALDITEEPDVLASYEEINAFYERQDRLHDVLMAPSVRLRVQDPRGATRDVLLEPSRRPMADLPGVFWFQLFAGASGFLIAAWVYATSPKNLAARCFLVMGAMFMGFTAPAAHYGTRELALDAETFRILAAINHVCAFAFGGGLVALFSSYPQRLWGARGIWVVSGLVVAWCVVDLAELADPDFGYRIPILAEQVGAIVLAGVQWFATRHDPRARAELRWLGMSVLVGAGLFVFSTAGMSLLGLTPPFAQGYAFGFFSLMYVGFALGLHRHQLLGLDEWAYRVLLWMLAAVLLIVLDLVMVLWLGTHSAVSLSAALLVSGFLYLPLRNWLWSRAVFVDQSLGIELFEGVIESAFAGSREAREERWGLLLKEHFDPAEVHRPSTPSSDAVRIEDNGVTMYLPATAGLGALKLSFPWRGRGLFGSRHLRLATTLVTLMRKTESAREAYARGALTERKRIARDLHDNLGARLLSGLYAENMQETREGIRYAISDMRSIVQELMTDQAHPLAQLLGDIRHETADRLRSANLLLDWPEPEIELGTQLSPAAVRNYTAILRELTTNTIRHAQASRVAITTRVIEDILETEFADDGDGMVSAKAGNGLHSVRTRVRDLGGELTQQTTESGTSFTIRIPLSADKAARLAPSLAME